jgi:glutamyl-tRNA reductase
VNRFYLLGCSFASCRFDRLARVALSAVECERVGDALVAAGVVDPVVLSTCNRVVILHASSSDRAADVFHALAEVKGADAVAPSDFFVLGERDAITHVFRLASGLESMVLGETQILGQLKDAFFRATERGWLKGHETRLLFDAAFRVAKRVRTDTDIGRGHFSVAMTAIRVLENRLGDLAGLRILIVGAGKTGELAARYFRERTGARLALANRTLSKAEQLAEEIGIDEVVLLPHVPERVTEFDVVVGAVEGGQYLFGPSELAGLRASRELYAVDLSMPPCVDPAVASIPGVTLIDIPSLQGVVSTNSERRLGAIPQAEDMIDEALDALERKLWEESELKPVLLRMHGKIFGTLSQVFPHLEEEVLRRGAERLASMHIRKIKDVQRTKDERRAHLEALRAVYSSLDE